MRSDASILTPCDALATYMLLYPAILLFLAFRRRFNSSIFWRRSLVMLKFPRIPLSVINNMVCAKSPRRLLLHSRAAKLPAAIAGVILDLPKLAVYVTCDSISRVAVCVSEQKLSDVLLGKYCTNPGANDRLLEPAWSAQHNTRY